MHTDAPRPSPPAPPIGGEDAGEFHRRVYRLNLGFLLGRGMVRLEHVGRVTGRPRYVCLAVIARPDPDRLVVGSVRGDRAQWVRNLRVTPECHVSTGWQKDRLASSRELSASEAKEVFAEFTADKPAAWRRLRRLITADGEPDRSLLMFEIHLR